MSDSQHRATFQPQGRAVSVLDGTTVLEAAAVAGMVMDTPCGGARWALLSPEARKHGEELARRARHVELSVDGDFQMEFAEAMILPDR